MNTSRRSLLLGLATASGAAAATMLTTTALADRGPAENPALLAAGEMLPGAMAEMAAATEDRQRIINEWWWRWPIAPAALVKPWQDSRAWERGLTGCCIAASGHTANVSIEAKKSDNPRPIFSSEDIAGAIKRVRSAMKRKRRDPFAPFDVYAFYQRGKLTIDQCDDLLRELSALHEAAVAYEAERGFVLEASGFRSADLRYLAALKAGEAAVRATLVEPAHTMAGVLVKAEALNGLGSLPTWQAAILGMDAHHWATTMGSEIVAIATQGSP